MNRNQKKKKFLKNRKNIIIIITIILVIFTAIKISSRNDTAKKDIVYNKNRSFTKKQKIKPKEELSMANQVVGVDLSNAHYLELKVKTK